MKPDRAPISADGTVDDIERAHLKEPGDASHVMHRYDAPAELTGLLRRFWIPVWSVPPGRNAPQKVLQYPVCLLVVTDEYARFYGVTSGLSTTTLTGDGWAVGVMCAPAAGYLIAGRSVAEHTDRSVDVADVLGGDGAVLVNRVRAAMALGPRSTEAHRLAIAAYADVLRRFLPVDAEGELVNRLVAFVETRSDITRAAQVSDAFGMSERALQRLVHRRLGCRESDGREGDAAQLMPPPRRGQP